LVNKASIQGIQGDRVPCVDKGRNPYTEVKMEYIYSALLLSKLGKEVNEHNVKKVLEAAGCHPDDAKIKALVSALKDVDIEKEIKEAATMQPVAAHQEAPKEDKKEKHKEEEKKDEETAAAGLGALFG